MAADNLFDLKIITPDRVFYSGKASFLELNTRSGVMIFRSKRLSVTGSRSLQRSPSGRMRLTATGHRKQRSVQNADCRMISPTSISRGQSWHCTRHWSVSNWQTM